MLALTSKPTRLREAAASRLFERDSPRCAQHWKHLDYAPCLQALLDASVAAGGRGGPSVPSNRSWVSDLDVEINNVVARAIVAVYPLSANLLVACVSLLVFASEKQIVRARTTPATFRALNAAGSVKVTNERA
jgi:hypothetical protein